MTKQMLRGIRVASKQELEDRIYLYFDEINADPVVFNWSYKLVSWTTYPLLLGDTIFWLFTFYSLY